MNQYQQTNYIHSEYNYTQPSKEKATQKNANWHSQFDFNNHNDYLNYKQQHKPEMKKNTINNRIRNRNQHYINKQNVHYIPRLQNINNELCNRTMNNYTVDRNYDIQHQFNQDSKQNIITNYEPQIQQCKSKNIFKSKKDDLNERMSLMKLRPNVQKTLPFIKNIPFLDMRPKNTSEIDYEEETY